MRNVLRSFRRRLWPATPRVHQPDFSDRRVFVELSAAGRDHAPLGRAVAAFHDGDTPTAMAGVAQYFRRRERPRFFIDADRIPDALDRVRYEHPAWMRRALDSIGREGGDARATPRARTAGLDESRWEAAAPGPGNDPLYSVQPHFFAFAPRLALASAYGNAVARETLERTVTTWMQVAVGSSGLPYLSDFTAGRRVLALSWAWAFLAGAADRTSGNTDRLEFALLKVLRADGEYLQSLVDTATPNNHKLTAAFVLWYLGILFPELAGSRRWREHGRDVWLRELENQTLPDGGEFEHALGYHLSVCEAAAAFILLGERNGEDVPGWVRERTRRALDFHVVVGGAQPRPLGDCGDYSLFPLMPWRGWTTGAIVELGRAMFGLPYAPAPPDDPGVERAFWLLGGSLAPHHDAAAPAPGLRSYPDAGCYVFTSSEPGTELLFRAGPAPGRPLFAGHMHADLLSVHVRSHGTPVLVEAGTYTYRVAAGRWRSYFAGPESHNGLIIKNHDPLGPVTGDFRPSHVDARVEARSAAAPSVMAWAEGVVRGGGAYTGHRRGVVAADLGFWVIYDLVGDHVPLADIAFAFQCEPEALVAIDADGAARVTSEKERLSIVASLGLLAASVHCGELDPPRGWVSPGYGRLQAAPQIRFASDQTRRATAFVVSQVHVAGRCRSLVVETLPCGSTTIEVGWADGTDRLLVHRGTGTRQVFGGEFDGAVLWVREQKSEPVAMRWLDARLVRFPALFVDVRAERPVSSLAGVWAGVTMSAR